MVVYSRIVMAESLALFGGQVCAIVVYQYDFIPVSRISVFSYSREGFIDESIPIVCADND